MQIRTVDATVDARIKKKEYYFDFLISGQKKRKLSLLKVISCFCKVAASRKVSHYGALR